MPAGVKRSADGNVAPVAKHFKPEIEPRRPLHGHHHGKVVRQANDDLVTPETLGLYRIYNNCDKKFYALNDTETIPNGANLRLIAGYETVGTTPHRCQSDCPPVIPDHDFCNEHVEEQHDAAIIQLGENRQAFFIANRENRVFANTINTTDTAILQNTCVVNTTDFPVPLVKGDHFDLFYAAKNRTIALEHVSPGNNTDGQPCPNLTLASSIHVASSTTYILEPHTPSPIITLSTATQTSSSTFSPVTPTTAGLPPRTEPNSSTSGLLLATLTPVGLLIGAAALVVAAYGVYRGVKWLTAPKTYAVNDPKSEPIYDSIDEPASTLQRHETVYFNPAFELVKTTV